MQKILNFFKEGIWLIPSDPSKPVRSFFLRTLRIFAGAVHGFNRDECFLKASALTFYTMLAVVPIIAIAFGIAKGFGFEAGMQREINAIFKNQPELAGTVAEFAHSLLKHAEGGIIAAIGTLILLWSILKLLSNTEHVLNTIWKAPNSRSLFRQFTDYLAILLLCPILFVTSSSLTLMLAHEVRMLLQQSETVQAFSPAISFTFRLIPYFFSSVLFTLIYTVMPNTKVSLKAGIIAGILAGCTYQLVQWFYIYFQIGLTNYGAIYGSFAALPLFLLWINTSWIIVFAGAEIAYRIECEQMEMIGQLPRFWTNQATAAVLIATHCLKRFTENAGPTPVTELAKQFGIPLNTARSIAFRLYQAGLLSQVQGVESYQPARLTLTLKDILNAMNPSLEKTVSIHTSSEYTDVLEALDRFEKAELANRPLLGGS